MRQTLQMLPGILKERDDTLKANKGMLGEIEMRDEALYQAAAKITDLELQLEEAMPETTITPRVATNIDPIAAETGGFADIQSSPPKAQTQPPRSGKSTSTRDHDTYAYQSMRAEGLIRMPSFLSDPVPDPATAALREMFMPREQSMMSLSMSMANESEGGDYEPFGERTLQSPRLSVISQSSLQSVYAAKTDVQTYRRQTDASEDSMDYFAVPLGQRKRDFTTGDLSKPSVKEWAQVVGKGGSFENVSARERKQRAPPAPEPGKLKGLDKYFSPKKDVEEPQLTRAALSQDKLHQILARKQVPNGIVQRQRQRFAEGRSSDSSPSFQAQIRQVKKNDKRDTAESLGHGRVLPPTPDTFSTNTLQHVNPSNETMNSTLATLNSTTYQLNRTVRKVPSFDDNKDKRRSRMGGQLFDPRPDPEFTSDKRLRRPRSYTETETSRREISHEWDIVTQSSAPTEQTVTETHSDFSSEATSKDAYGGLRPNPNGAAFNPPNMFNFMSQERPQRAFDPRRDEWDISRDITTPEWRTGTAMGHRHDSDLTRTPTKSAYRQRSHSTFSSDTRRRSYVAPPSSNSPYKPIKTPERRSSLATTTPISNEKRLKRLQEHRADAEREALKSPSPMKPSAPSTTFSCEPLLNTAQLQHLTTLTPLPHLISNVEQKKNIFQRFNLRNVSNSLGMGSKEAKQFEEERATPPPIARSMTKAEKARRDARERHLRPHGLSSSPAKRLEGMMERPATSHGEGREQKRVMTFGDDQTHRLSQPSQSGSRGGDLRNGDSRNASSRIADSHQGEAEELDAQKAAEVDAGGGKKWGFSLGNRTFRRNK